MLMLTSSSHTNTDRKGREVKKDYFSLIYDMYWNYMDHIWLFFYLGDLDSKPHLHHRVVRTK